MKNINFICKEMQKKLTLNHMAIMQEKMKQLSFMSLKF